MTAKVEGAQGACGPDPYVCAVLETVARARGEPVGRLEGRLDADLVTELGLDSIQVLGVWAALEERFGLPEGELGVSQPITVRMIAAALARPNLGSSRVSPTLGRAEIEALIPHRPPLLMLDRVLECVPGQRGVGERTLRPDDLCFAGHFPGQPILPGAFIIEACGQLLAVVCRTAADRSGWSDRPPIAYLAGVERFKFLSPVVPGEVLTVEARIGRRVGGLLQARVVARVAGRPVAEGVLNVTARE